MVEKCNFLKGVKIPYQKNRFLVTLRAFFSTYKFFPGRGWYFPVSTSKEEYFSEKMSSLAGLPKNIQFSAKLPFWPFLTTWVHFQSRVSQRTGKISENPQSISRGKVVRNIVLFFQFSIFKKVRGGSPFATRHFPKSVILASCTSVGRPFVACCACSIAIFHSSL